MQCCDVDLEDHPLKSFGDQSPTDLYVPTVNLDTQLARAPWRSPVHPFEGGKWREQNRTPDTTSGDEYDAYDRSNTSQLLTARPNLERHESLVRPEPRPLALSPPTDSFFESTPAAVSPSAAGPEFQESAEPHRALQSGISRRESSEVSPTRARRLQLCPCSRSISQSDEYQVPGSVPLSSQVNDHKERKRQVLFSSCREPESEHTARQDWLDRELMTARPLRPNDSIPPLSSEIETLPGTARPGYSKPTLVMNNNGHWRDYADRDRKTPFKAQSSSSFNESASIPAEPQRPPAIVQSRPGDWTHIREAEEGGTYRRPLSHRTSSMRTSSSRATSPRPVEEATVRPAMVSQLSTEKSSERRPNSIMSRKDTQESGIGQATSQRRRSHATSHHSRRSSPPPEAASHGRRAGLCCRQKDASDDGEEYRLPLPSDNQSIRADRPDPTVYQSFEVPQASVVEITSAKTISTVSTLDLDASGDGTPRLHALGIAASSNRIHAMTHDPAMASSRRSQCVEKFVTQLHSDQLGRTVLMPAAIAWMNCAGMSDRPQKVLWSSVKIGIYPATAYSQLPLGLSFQLWDDGRLRSKLDAPDVIAHRGSTFDLSLTLVSTDDDGTHRMFSDTFVTLPATSSFLIKEEEGICMTPQELVKFHGQILVTVMRVSHDCTGTLVKDFEAVYRSPAFGAPVHPIADVTVVCDKVVFPASRAMLTARSTVFRQMLAGKSRAVIAITGASPEIVRSLVDFIHTDRCDILSHCDDISNAVRLFEAATRFTVVTLANDLALRLAVAITPATLAPIKASATKTKHAYLSAAVQAYEEVLTHQNKVAFAAPLPAIAPHKEDLMMVSTTESLPDTPERHSPEIRVTPP